MLRKFRKVYLVVLILKLPLHPVLKEIEKCKDESKKITKIIFGDVKISLTFAVLFRKGKFFEV
jgi:hypothetical protein